MQYILHDARVALWAWWARHPEYREFRIAVVWPISIRRYPYSISNAWIVRIQRPSLHLLNAYVVELDYQLEHTSSEPK